MDEKLAYWGSVTFGALALVMIIVNIPLSSSNRTMQIDVSQRQQQIAGGQQLNQINQGMIQAMAQSAIKNGNTGMRDLLEAQGFRLKTDANGGDNQTKPSSKK